MNRKINADQPLAAPAIKPTIVVVGNGMAGCRFCIEFVNHGLSQKFNLLVFGQEPTPAYNRIHLCAYGNDGDFDKIVLKPVSWYGENNIELKLDESVDVIDQQLRTLQTVKNNSYGYDHLVLATGSSPYLPPLPGIDLSGVFAIRTVGDIDDIVSHCHQAKVAAIIGGGVLGIEAANFIKTQGLETHVFEVGEHLMSRQLDSKGAGIFQANIEGLGFYVHTDQRIMAVTQQSSGGLVIELADGQRFACELVILSTGIRANTALVENLDIAVSKLKGIHVNDKLQTSAQNIYAIGECALFEQQPCELLALGYRMAEVLAGRFNGHSQLVYVKLQNVTRLKMPAQSVISIGDIDAELPSIEYACEGTYRKIFYQQGLIVGAIGVGQWDEADQTQLAVANQYKLQQRQLKSFAKCGLLWPNVNPLKLWDDATVICQCMGVRKGSLVTQVKQGCNTLPALANATQATTLLWFLQTFGAEVLHRTTKSPTPAFIYV